MKKINQLKLMTITLLLFSNITFGQKLIDDQFLGDIYHANAQVGQYLPDWRPDTDYRNNYGAKLKWGGGILWTPYRRALMDDENIYDINDKQSTYFCKNNLTINNKSIKLGE